MIFPTPRAMLYAAHCNIYTRVHVAVIAYCPGGELLSVRRKSHLLQAEWYARLAEAGEQERKVEEPIKPGYSPFLKD